MKTDLPLYSKWDVKPEPTTMNNHRCNVLLLSSSGKEEEEEEKVKEK